MQHGSDWRVWLKEGKLTLFSSMEICVSPYRSSYRNVFFILLDNCRFHLKIKLLQPYICFNYKMFQYERKLKVTIIRVKGNFYDLYYIIKGPFYIFRQFTSNISKNGFQFEIPIKRDRFVCI